MDDGCRICGSSTRPAGFVDTDFSGRRFFLRHCDACHFSFVENPRTDYAVLYGADYYAGAGADRSVDYASEMSDPRTVREYEHRGILEAVRALAPIGAQTRWLDYGCGLGGLVRHCRRQGLAGVVGTDVGYAAEHARSNGIPVVDQDDLARAENAYDVVTAIEVLEHVDRPLELLRTLHRVLRPGGLLFLTTGNASSHRSKLSSWRYVCPEVHLSFFEPKTMARALEFAGFRAEYRGFVAGFEDIIRYKVLKVLGMRRKNRIEQALPWGLLTRMVDRKEGVSAHPIGVK